MADTEQGKPAPSSSCQRDVSASQQRAWNFQQAEMATLKDNSRVPLPGTLLCVPLPGTLLRVPLPGKLLLVYIPDYVFMPDPNSSSSTNGFDGLCGADDANTNIHQKLVAVSNKNFGQLEPCSMDEEDDRDPKPKPTSTTR
ncbi:unnamed protein product [Triticum turgidum subsp. durum]|uniref:Uncharacterized protein n=1 Tax=Triticum turgidum subsp. durum TaxID=4567 RepID=A0A9R0UU46_TRITD|nr:unnamed protein product [Triticum turgidum subsp. durum]